MMVLESEKDIYSDLENLLESDFFSSKFCDKDPYRETLES